MSAQQTKRPDHIPEIKDLGRLDYRSAWRFQKEWVEKVLSGRDSGVSDGETIAFLEHDPVYTLGFHGNAGNLLASESSLKAEGIECIRIERGGDITYHGPGQLVMYPIIDIAGRGIGVKKYIEMLEKSVISLLSRYGIKATSNNDAIGVWIEWGSNTERKICAIGVKVRHGVTMHGLALNVITDLAAFGRINPCGFADKGVTSMERETGKRYDLRKVGHELAEIVKEGILRLTK